MSTYPISVTINGKKREREVEARRLLVHFLREELALTGTHIGCDTSQCSACAVLVDGEVVKSCTMFAVQVNGSNIVTVEGIAEDGRLHPLQESLWAYHGLQCGYCTAGMIMSSYDLLARNPDPSEQEIRDALHGNLCRCTGYQQIVQAVKHAAQALQREARS